MEFIDKSSSIPYYVQLADILKRHITEEKATTEVVQLPSENELATSQGITRATVRRALDILERDRWIYRERGKGSFATQRRVEQELTRLVSTTEDLRARGWTVATKLLALECISAPSKVARALEMAPGAPCYRLTRLRIVDDEPISLQTPYLPAAMCPNLEDQDLTQSLWRLLETRYRLRLSMGRELLRARCALPHEQALLELTGCLAIMYTERVTYNITGEPVEYLEAVWRGDRYDFTVPMSREQP